MKDIVGYSSLAVSLIGQFLLARGNKRGWLVRIIASFGWGTFALLNRSGPLILTTCCYLAIDSYGMWRRRARG